MPYQFTTIVTTRRCRMFRKVNRTLSCNVSHLHKCQWLMIVYLSALECFILLTCDREIQRESNNSILLVSRKHASPVGTYSHKHMRGLLWCYSFYVLYFKMTGFPNFNKYYYNCFLKCSKGQTLNFKQLNIIWQEIWNTPFKLNLF